MYTTKYAFLDLDSLTASTIFPSNQRMVTFDTRVDSKYWVKSVEFAQNHGADEAADIDTMTPEFQMSKP